MPGTDYVAQNPVVHVFDGEGGYAGLIAALQLTGARPYDFQDETHTFWGYILDARQLREAPKTASTR